MKMIEQLKLDLWSIGGGEDIVKKTLGARCWVSHINPFKNREKGSRRKREEETLEVGLKEA